MAIAPRAKAPEPFVDFLEVLDKLPRDQKAAAVGISNWKLIDRGVVEWKDVVTPSRVRDLREVVSLKGLTVGQMTKAGVRLRIAEEAHQAVHTAAHEHAERHRRELAAKLVGAGLSHERLSRELASRLAARVGIAEGAGIAAQRLPGVGGSHAAELAKLLTVATITRVAMGPRPAFSASVRAAIGRELGHEATLGVDAFLAAIEAGLAMGRKYGAVVMRAYRRLRGQR